MTFSGNAAVSNGGAIYNDGSSPTLTNVVFAGNTSNLYGGAIYNRAASNPSLTDVTFSDNTADRGGGIYNTTSNPTLVNVVFAGNEACNNQGGGICNYMGSSASLTNVTFSGNTAPYGGGMFNNNSSPTLVNTIMWGDWASSRGMGLQLVERAGRLPRSSRAGCRAAASTGHNVLGNPLSVDRPGGDLHLGGPPSPAFDSGNNAAPSIAATTVTGTTGSGTQRSTWGHTSFRSRVPLLSRLPGQWS